jgi:uncharacterized protein with von Willebrand factor type A (vWA) domain
MFGAIEPHPRSPALPRQPAPPPGGWPSLTSWPRAEASEEGEEEVPGASETETMAQKDFSAFGADELREIERIAARIARKFAARPSRRWKAARRGPRIDLRRTLRRAPANAAELLELRYRIRRPRKTRIVALCDVSGSMDLYSRLLLQFLFALQGTVARVETFVFATELRRVTELLEDRTYHDALRELSAGVRGWSGGTRIGACLSTFLEDWSTLLGRRTVVVILSDGWDTGDPELLSAGLEALKMRSRKLVWLNPLLGSPGYQPLATGMQAALPHLSVFAPAHNLESLRALEHILLA